MGRLTNTGFSFNRSPTTCSLISLLIGAALRVAPSRRRGIARDEGLRVHPRVLQVSGPTESRPAALPSPPPSAVPSRIEHAPRTVSCRQRAFSCVSERALSPVHLAPPSPTPRALVRCDLQGPRGRRGEDDGESRGRSRGERQDRGISRGATTRGRRRCVDVGCGIRGERRRGWSRRVRDESGGRRGWPRWPRTMARREGKGCFHAGRTWNGPADVAWALREVGPVGASGSKPRVGASGSVPLGASGLILRRHRASARTSGEGRARSHGAVHANGSRPRTRER